MTGSWTTAIVFNAILLAISAVLVAMVRRKGPRVD